MIVRILGEAQYELDDSSAEDLEHLDARLNKAIEDGDEAGFGSALAELITKVRTSGTAVDPSRFVPSELTVPHEGSTVSEVRELLNSEDNGGS
jgi:hypothetical protein